MTKVRLAVLLATTAIASPLAAQDLTVSAGAEFIRNDDPDRTTSLETYVTAERAGLSFGVNAYVDREEDSEYVSLSLGYAQELDNGFDYDASYAVYFYTGDSSENYHEASVSLGYYLTEMAYVNVGIADPDNDESTVTLLGEYYFGDTAYAYASYEDYGGYGSWDFGAEYYIGDNLALVANVGLNDSEGDEEDGDPPFVEDTEWDIGGYYYLGAAQEASVDLRWYDGDGSDYADGGYLGLTLTYDTTLLGG